MNFRRSNASVAKALKPFNDLTIKVAKQSQELMLIDEQIAPLHVYCSVNPQDRASMARLRKLNSDRCALMTSLGKNRIKLNAMFNQ